MTIVRLPEDALRALNDGKSVEVKSPNFGKAGHNGTVLIEPGEPETYESIEVHARERRGRYQRDRQDDARDGHR